MSVLRALGVISGTSMDGIDVALVETDGRAQVKPGPGATYPYPPELRERLLAVIADAASAESAPLTGLEAAVTAAHGDAIARLLDERQVGPVDVIGFHGQTILHRPQRRLTRQLGDGAAIAARFGVRTVSRFRHADVAAGGEGAPLVPLYHQALAARLPQPLMVLNLGGVGNVTYIDGDTVIAFDTGPASAMLDDFVRRRRGVPFDADGRVAASGRPVPALVARFAAHPWFDRPAPKSLDRNDFHAATAWVEGLSDEDGAATLAEFTVVATVAALRHVPRAPVRWLVTGGGRHNRHFVRRFAAELHVPVEPVEAVGWDGDFLEAQCFGYLAVRSLLGLPLSLPTTTGVPRPLTGGEIATP
ncbi:MAG: anhydro-N-acetylmuramic acid kinase [Bradyrhizobiaceae bacterium]|nr:MAG: anhydro-N-acetylmuramic acid kinase [Bradyrhizobiaceae bacterium]